MHRRQKTSRRPPPRGPKMPARRRRSPSVSRRSSVRLAELRRESALTPRRAGGASAASPSSSRRALRRASPSARTSDKCAAAARDRARANSRASPMTSAAPGTPAAAPRPTGPGASRSRDRPLRRTPAEHRYPWIRPPVPDSLSRSCSRTATPGASGARVRLVEARRVARWEAAVSFTATWRPRSPMFPHTSSAAPPLGTVGSRYAGSRPNARAQPGP